MARLSERLVSLGYYDEKEKPRVSYKENPIKIFNHHKKRRSNQYVSHTYDEGTPETHVCDTSEWRTPTPFNLLNTSISTSSSDISTTSISDGWESTTPFELPASPVLFSASVVDEAGDQPGNQVTESSEETVLTFDNNNEPAVKSWLLRKIGMILLVVLLILSASLNRTGYFCQMNALKTICWGPGCSESESFRMVQEKLKLVQEELHYLRSRLLPKGLTMPNFALESQGARVIQAYPSQMYRSPTQPPLRVFLGVPVWYPLNSPRTAIQGHTESLVPGHCWAFPGQRGYLFISLSQPISISHVTLGHISREHAPPGFMHSAPQDFSVCGFLSEDGEGTDLGTFTYNPDGESFQTFKLPGPTQTFRYIMLEILTNWGHPEYTCVYSFKVHGGEKIYNKIW